MRKIALIALTALPLFAGFFPQTTHTTVSKISDKSVILNNPFPVDGMTGIVVHNYGNDAEAITSRVRQNTSGKVTLLDGDIIHHDNLPTISTSVAAGDKVIGGYLYNNVLVLAPNAQVYKNITSTYHKTWIHPDLFALFLAEIGDNIPTTENLKAFAKSYQVGLIYIVGHDGAKLLDPISGQIVGQKPMTGLPEKGKSPFFMRFDEIDSGIFSSDDHTGYYKLMDTL
ncbi:MAG TPA: hypothetical protein ENK98_06180 [Epsilonproteobacteria bacterium]|nr:hypothetical protein [Campylobacterota bacterium]HHD79203.1 hypothetical protein [Campylobacterota bacterium]